MKVIDFKNKYSEKDLKFAKEFHNDWVHVLLDEDSPETVRNSLLESPQFILGILPDTLEGLV